jgi:hypothetical protein
LTFKDLRKFIEKHNFVYNNDSCHNQEELIGLNSERFAIFYNKSFWIENIDKHKAEDIRTRGFCCFNHIIGLPKKDGIEKPIFDYEMKLVEGLDNTKNIFIKKARGLGITELLLRYMTWLAVRNNDYNGCRYHIVTGPRINLAENLIDRLHGLFISKLGIDCKQVGPIIYINNVIFQAFPSHTISSSRGYTNVKFIFIDEAAFFPPGQQDEVRAVCEAYRPKSNPYIVMVSTPYKPGDLFEQIDRDPNSVFKKYNLHYSLGLNKLYNPDEIEREKHAADLISKYNLMSESNRVFIDGSQSGFIRSVKYQTGDYPHYERLIEKARQDGRPDELHHYMQVIQ